MQIDVFGQIRHFTALFAPMLVEILPNTEVSSVMMVLGTFPTGFNYVSSRS